METMKMHAHEALLLGFTALRPLAHTVDSPLGGCALRALEIAGFESTMTFLYDQRAVISPCQCGYRGSRYSQIMIHLFNEHVAPLHEFASDFGCVSGSSERWTVEQLADWLRSVDPGWVATDADEPTVSQKEAEQPEAACV